MLCEEMETDYKREQEVSGVMQVELDHSDTRTFYLSPCMHVLHQCTTTDDVELRSRYQGIHIIIRLCTFLHPTKL